ncbi:DUF927 domain-containing protein [Thiomicrorhabdus xiamenensis]|uniref:DUF927 domain-containing protein n=1 Tax=Thiomicrorhabdus xiamenensis TaxID=2739063 RepID=A0A7D4P5S4_9GAMM|nr:DUF927 domain-containing protein [Thiomicrorhabdus xiamenensis]QKI89915.1 DUF927 domain-containing protein [Thiomicrorhabdus xiamenensis]
MSDNKPLDFEKAKKGFKKAVADDFYKNAVFPEGFESGASGISFKDPDHENAKEVRICSHIKVSAVTCDIEGNNWGYVLEFKDRLNRVKKWVMPAEMLGGRGDLLHGTLLNMGVRGLHTSRAKNLLNEFIQNTPLTKVVTCTNKTGWNLENSVYVLPDRTIAPPDSKEVVYQSEIPASLGFESKGTLQEWRENVSAFAVNNSRPCLAISAAFAAPLLTPLGVEGGGLHLRGDSSQGKTTALFMAGSVWGSHQRKQTWRATDNGLEIAAYQHNDNLLLLDEMGEMDPKVIGKTVYMLANGLTKTRGNNGGKIMSWRTLFLSTGELSLKNAMKSAGLEAKAGQEVRLLDIEAQCSEALGIYDELFSGMGEGKKGAIKQSKTIVANTGEYYGLAGIEFINRLITDKEGALEAVRKAQEAFMQTYLPKDANSTIGRGLGMFATVAGAGELATVWGLTGWPQGMAFKLVGECAKNWMYSQPSISDSLEEQQAIERVKVFIERNNEGGFMDMDAHRDHQAKTVYKYGYVKYDHEAEQKLFCFTTSNFNEVISGLDPKTVFRVLRKYGYLKTNKAEFDKRTGKTKQRNTYKIAPPELNKEKEEAHRKNKVSVYAVYASILNHGHGEEPEPSTEQQAQA